MPSYAIPADQPSRSAIRLLVAYASSAGVAAALALTLANAPAVKAAPAPELGSGSITGGGQLPSGTGIGVPGVGAPGMGVPGMGGNPAAGSNRKTPVESAADKRCREEVAQAFAAQRDQGAFSMKTRMIDQRGVVFMTVDYELPTNMRQRVKTLGAPEAIETVLVSGRAWTRTGASAKWQPLKMEQVGALSDQLNATVVEPPRDPLRYRCTDDLSIEGKTVKTFEGEQLNALGKTEPNSPIRIVHVDDATGLPIMNAVAPKGQPDKPFFKATYTYPEGLKITPPAGQ
ncbi:MAG: hypothetical protein AAFV45_11920 [Pseudomonadota bacterium]